MDKLTAELYLTLQAIQYFLYFSFLWSSNQNLVKLLLKAKGLSNYVTVADELGVAVFIALFLSLQS